MDVSTIHQWKLALGNFVGLSFDALHLHIALAVQLLSARLLRRSLGSPLPWLIIFVITCIGETYDRTFQLTFEHLWRWGSSVHDVINTMFWPTMLLILARTKAVPGLGTAGKR